MKFSTKSRYALRLMAELARYAPGTTVSLKEISERQNLSLKYLEQIVTPLARVGLVKSERGSQGGYRLTKAPADYTAGEILRAIEGSVAPIPCLGSGAGRCHQPVHRQWHAGAAGPEPFLRQRWLLRLQFKKLKFMLDISPRILYNNQAFSECSIELGV